MRDFDYLSLEGVKRSDFHVEAHAELFNARPLYLIVTRDSFFHVCQADENFRLTKMPIGAFRKRTEAYAYFAAKVLQWVEAE